MTKLNNENLNEVLQNSNHNSIESINNAIYSGDIEVFENEEKYLNSGYDFKNTDKFLILNDNKVVYFID